jgi:heat shock protein HslJ
MKEMNMNIRKQAQRSLFTILILVTLLGCSQKTDELVGTNWKLVSLNGKDLIEGTTITLNFADGYLYGEMDCNGYGGSHDGGQYRATDDGTFELDLPLAVTLQLCNEPEGIMEQEYAYIEALGNAAYFQIVDNYLEIKNENGETILTFQSK